MGEEGEGTCRNVNRNGKKWEREVIRNTQKESSKGKGDGCTKIKTKKRKEDKVKWKEESRKSEMQGRRRGGERRVERGVGGKWQNKGGKKNKAGRVGDEDADDR